MNNSNISSFTLPIDSGAQYGGLGKRELFAALLLQGIMVNNYHPTARDWCVEQAVKAADALIKELGKAEKNESSIP